VFNFNLRHYYFVYGKQPLNVGTENK